ncbi:50S ribosomal protein L9 [Candidatus Peregrinibacteria bacterium]|nr:50S ribosomal protein L9 [Candidatus Peregrinibacteria bacterium]
MKVIFTDNVQGVATRGDVKNVKSGFYRNFLLPRKKAVLATEPILKEWEERRKHMLIEKENLKTQLKETKRRLEGAKVRLEKKVTAKGTLYGGVKAIDVVKAIKEQLNIEVPATAVIVGTAIKAVGNHSVKLHLGEGVEVEIPVEVAPKK